MWKIVEELACRSVLIGGGLYCPKFRESKKMRDETRFRCKLS